MDPGFVACIEAGSKITMADYQKTRLVKYAYCAEINHFFDDWDFLLTPAVSVAAFPAELLQPEHWPQHPWDWLSWAEFSYPFNLSQNPGGVGALRLHQGRTCRSACRSSAGGSTISACCRCRRPSRRCGPGRTSGRRLLLQMRTLNLREDPLIHREARET